LATHVHTLQLAAIIKCVALYSSSEQQQQQTATRSLLIESPSWQLFRSQGGAGGQQHACICTARAALSRTGQLHSSVSRNGPHSLQQPSLQVQQSPHNDAYLQNKRFTNPIAASTPC
jgi:hypothetical protein